MKQGIDVGVMGKTSAVAGSSVVDSNRFYSMLLDARTVVNASENMHDVSEKLLKGEKDNAKGALDQLWALKKTLSDDESGEVIEMLITYYQDKINVLRDREETIKKVNKETRALIEEKRKKEEELSVVKSELAVSTRELGELNTKIDTLKRREEELAISERVLRTEICVNESKVVTGLQDIILHKPESGAEKEGAEAPAAEGAKQARPAEAPKPVAAPTPAVAPAAEAPTLAVIETPKPAEAPTLAAVETPKPAEAPTLAVIETPKPAEAPTLAVIETPKPVAAPRPAAPPPQPYYEGEPIPIYPKSVVRMGGKVIGEYYHDGNITQKDLRHYIYNSHFMSDRLTDGLRSLKALPDQDVHSELVKIAEDAANRVRDNEMFHFEVSTNEIINDKNLRELSADLRCKAWDNVEEFAVKLNAKIEALGVNYEGMLQEQMARCAERE